MHFLEGSCPYLDFGKFVTFDVVLQDAVTVLQTHNSRTANARVSYPVGI